MYLPTDPQPNLQSFTAPILNLQDTRISAPFFGPNVWSGVLKPVTGGGIPAQHAFVEIKMVFKEGGAFDFHSTYERIRDSLIHAMENARDSGSEMDPSNVHLDQLPAYDETGSTQSAMPQARRDDSPLIAPTPRRPGQERTTRGQAAGGLATSTPQQFEPPSEPPPGYEEAQSAGVENSLEESMRRANV